MLTLIHDHCTASYVPMLCSLQGNITEENYDEVLTSVVILVVDAGPEDQTTDNFVITTDFLVVTAQIVSGLDVVEDPEQVGRSVVCV